MTASVPEDISRLLGMGLPAAGGAFTILDEEQVALLVDAVAAVLDRVGMVTHSPVMLRALEAGGARVDYDASLATLPRDLVLSFASAEQASRATAPEPARRFEAPIVPWVFHPLAPFYYDDRTGLKRAGNRDDFVTMTKLGDALHPQHGVGHSLVLSDVPTTVEPLEAALLLAEYAHRPRGVYVQDVRQMPYLEEMAAIAGEADPYWPWLANVGFSTPLRLGKDIADRFVYMVKSGRYPAQVYNFAVCGVNMPVTIAGRTVVAAAEIVALWMAARALNPSVALDGALVQMASADMRTGEISYWAPDALMGSLMTCELLRRWTGVPVSAGTGEYVSSPVPGSYVALEKAYRAMTVAAFTGCHPCVGIGHLEAGLSISPVQLLLDRDVSAALGLLQTPALDAESIGLDTILAVGHGEHGTYLESEHTLRHFRQSLWMPRYLDRNGWSGAEGEAQVLARAQDHVNDLLTVYQKPDFDPDRLERMRQVVSRARRDLSSS